MLPTAGPSNPFPAIEISTVPTPMSVHKALVRKMRQQEATFSAEGTQPARVTRRELSCLHQVINTRQRIKKPNASHKERVRRSRRVLRFCTVERLILKKNQLMILIFYHNIRETVFDSLQSEQGEKLPTHSSQECNVCFLIFQTQEFT